MSRSFALPVSGTNPYKLGDKECQSRVRVLPATALDQNPFRRQSMRSTNDGDELPDCGEMERGSVITPQIELAIEVNHDYATNLSVWRWCPTRHGDGRRGSLRDADFVTSCSRTQGASFSCLARPGLARFG